MVVRKRWAPASEHADEASLVEMFLDPILKQVCQAEPGQCRFKRHVRIVKHQPPLDTYLQLAPIHLAQHLIRLPELLSPQTWSQYPASSPTGALNPLTQATS